MAVRLCTNLILLNRIHPFVAVLLIRGPTCVATSVKEHKRVGQWSNQGGMGKIGENRRRVACTRILDSIDQWGFYPLRASEMAGQTNNSITSPKDIRVRYRFPRNLRIVILLFIVI